LCFVTEKVVGVFVHFVRHFILTSSKGWFVSQTTEPDLDA
jgi:hypothetical protein